MVARALFFVLSILIVLRLAWADAPAETRLTRFAFGSCLHQDKPQEEIWAAIRAFEPQAFLFLGDNIYAATNVLSERAKAYAKLAAQPGYQGLTQSSKVLAIWDDNDYGEVDGGASFGAKEESRLQFLDFFKVPLPRAVWAREGIYDSYWFGEKPHNVHLILLDTRTFRSDLLPAKERPPEKGPYRPHYDMAATVLGETQWNWFALELKQPAALTIVASSIQVLSDEHGYESWGNFPLERERLLTVLKKATARRVILLSGDRHHAEFSELRESGGRGIFELTAGSMNMEREHGEEPNQYRIGERFLHGNFGALVIDWNDTGFSVDAQVRNKNGAVELSQRLSGF